MNGVVQKLKSEHIPVALLNKPSMDTHILVADSVSGDYTQLLQTAKTIPVRVFFSNTVVQAKNTITVNKPPQAAQLYEIMKKLLAKLSAMKIQEKRPIQPASSSVAAESPTPSPVVPVVSEETQQEEALAAALQASHETEAETKPKPAVPVLQKNTDHLFALILKAKRDKLNLQVNVNNGPTLFINGASKTIWHDGDSVDLDTLLQSAPETMSVAVLDNVDDPTGQIFALDNLLWKAAILCSEGEILEGHVMDQPITLRAWPNFTRQSFDPTHLKISALLAKESMSLNQLSSLCQVPIEHVINFYNAAFAVDLIERRNRPREDSEKKRKSTPVLKDMLSRLAKKLKIQ